MKFYRHYKNKPYRILGIAKHSETLQDLVVYETLYENPTASLWVRPKEIFFSSIEVDGQLRPRFEKIPLDIKLFQSPSDTQLKSIMPIVDKSFTQWSCERFRNKIQKQKNLFLTLGLVDNEAVGFKLGYEYEQDEETFYSWIGAVLPQFRRLGVARELMQAQHDWCRTQGYKKVRTKSQNSYPGMLILNVKTGFEVVGTENSSSDKSPGPRPYYADLKIIMEKKL